MANMLRGLDKVSWQTLKTCAGSAHEIPGLLRTLIANDAEVRAQALEKLSDAVDHQGGLCEASVHIVPFLIELLTYESVKEKPGILALLWLIYSGGPALNAERDAWLKPLYEKEHRDFVYEANVAQAIAKTAHEAVREGIAIYIELLKDSDPTVRLGALWLLACFTTESSRITPEFMSIIRSEQEAEVKATAIIGLGKLMTGIPAQSSTETSVYTQLLVELLKAKGEVLVRFAASLSLLEIARSNAPVEAANVISDAVAHPERYPDLPWGDVVIWGACDALCKLGVDNGSLVLEEALKVARNPDDAHIVALTLLDLVFKGADKRISGFSVGFSTTPEGKEQRTYEESRKKLDIQRLTLIQRRVAKAVLEANQVWEIQSNLLAIYGLPASRDKLRRLLA